MKNADAKRIVNTAEETIIFLIDIYGPKASRHASDLCMHGISSRKSAKIKKSESLTSDMTAPDTYISWGASPI